MKSNFLFLILSLSGFFLAPFLVKFGKTKKSLYSFIDGFTISSIILVTFFHLIPEAIQQAGLGALVFFILGFLSPKLLHSTQNELIIFVIFLLLHTFLESSALAISNTSNLALAIGIHNLPIGIFIFTRIQISKGKIYAFLTILLIFISALFGFFLAEKIYIVQRFQFHLQAFIASSIIHILFESLHEKLNLIEDNKKSGILQKYYISSTLGVIIGIFSLLLFTNDVFKIFQTNHPRLPISSIFLNLFLETAPILLLAFLLSGALRIILTPNNSRWLRTGSPLLQSLKGVIFGLPLPICSCGVLPLYRTLIQTGVPATAGMAFLIATPEIGLDALLISIPLLGVEFSIYRLISAFLVAFIIAYFIGKNVPTCELLQTTESETTLKLSEKIKLGFRYGFMELFDHIMPWLIFGIMIASLFESLVNYEILENIPYFIQIPVVALLGIPTYVCATGATPFVAIAVQKGISLGAGLAFLISGPATNIATFSTIRNLHGKKTAYLFVLSIFFLAIILGFVLDFLSFNFEKNNFKIQEERFSLLNWISLAILGILFLYSLLRIGPRAVLEQIHEHYH